MKIDQPHLSLKTTEHSRGIETLKEELVRHENVVQELGKSVKLAKHSRGIEILKEELVRHENAVQELSKCVKLIEETVNQHDIVDDRITLKLEALKNKIQQSTELFKKFQADINLNELADSEDDA